MFSLDVSMTDISEITLFYRYLKNLDIAFQKNFFFKYYNITTFKYIHFGAFLIIVPPTPGKILVKGCDVFGKCHLPSETRNITCEVRNVYPPVTLSIKALTSNVIVTETDPKSHEVSGLTSVAVYGTVTMSKGICGEDIVVQCRAIGLAAYVFNSEVDITIVNGTYPIPPH